MAVKDEIRSFLETNFGAKEIDDQKSLMESGTIDSMGIIELIDFMETTYGIKVEDDEVVEANFGSVAKMDAYLAGKKNG